MLEHQQESDQSSSTQNNAGLVLFLVNTWATSIEVFIRANFGERYLGLQAAAVFLLVPIYCGVKQATDYGMMSLYLFIYLFLCFVHRQTIRRRRRRGLSCHSYYDGTPALWKLCPWCSELTVKRYAEPAVVITSGLLLIPASEPVGMYLLIGGLCMGFSTGVCCVQQDVRLLDLNDSILDQQILAERLREVRGDRF